MKDFNCHMQLKMEDALMIEKAVHDKYAKYHQEGRITKCEQYLHLLLKLEKIIRGHKGYETHEFSAE